MPRHPDYFDDGYPEGAEHLLPKEVGLRWWELMLRWMGWRKAA